MRKLVFCVKPLTLYSLRTSMTIIMKITWLQNCSSSNKAGKVGLAYMVLKSYDGFGDGVNVVKCTLQQRWMLSMLIIKILDVLHNVSNLVFFVMLTRQRSKDFKSGKVSIRKVYFTSTKIKKKWRRSTCLFTSDELHTI